ncbi:hypothetical protein BKK49_10170 [Rodentibacter rarus]|uniref:Uncharacterized protein n=1 Tax=Rodentibacter rarus TaxID=1908260 RepID=A0A1V3IRE0_9PAST|nr:hypothetical protein [Rodentibacter rarus]OOF38142.1 hypothetical protein BKK49_10170 [Rodentibacter rarus]OOF44524.1 hypothetical protein BKK50_02475 [Rodentibacter rarus]
MNKRLKAGIYATVLSLTMGGIISSQVVAQDNQTTVSSIKAPQNPRAELIRILKKLDAKIITNEADRVFADVGGAKVMIEGIEPPFKFWTSISASTGKVFSLNKLNSWLLKDGSLFPNLILSEDKDMLLLRYILFNKAQVNKKVVDEDIEYALIYLLFVGKKLEENKFQFEE